MRNSILLALALIGITLINSIQAQTSIDSNKNNYFVLTRNVSQLKPIILAAEELAKNDGEHFGEYQVVICGKTVSDLTDEIIMNDLVKMAEVHHVKLFACGFSLQKFNVEERELPEQVQVVENGILYGFELEKRGFYAITL